MASRSHTLWDKLCCRCSHPSWTGQLTSSARSSVIGNLSTHRHARSTHSSIAVQLPPQAKPIKSRQILQQKILRKYGSDHPTIESIEKALDQRQNHLAYQELARMMKVPFLRSKITQKHLLDLLVGLAHSSTIGMDRSKDVLNWWVELKFPIRLELYNLLLEGHIRVKDLKGFEDILEEMSTLKLNFDRRTWNLRLRALTLEIKKGDSIVERALALIDQMASSSIKPDICSYTTVITIASRVGHVSTVNAVSQIVQREKLQPDKVFYAALLNCYTKHAPEQVLPFWKSIPHEARDPFMYTTLLSFHGQLGDIASAKSTWDEMRSSNILPTHVSYTALMQAFITTGDLESAEKVFFMMHGDGIDPSVTTYSMLIAAFLKHDRIQHALDFVSTVQGRVTLESTILESLATYCSERRLGDEMMVVFNLARQEKKINTIRMSFFENIIQGLFRINKPDEARQVWRFIKSHELLSQSITAKTLDVVIQGHLKVEDLTRAARLVQVAKEMGLAENISKDVKESLVGVCCMERKFSHLAFITCMLGIDVVASTQTIVQNIHEVVSAIEWTRSTEISDQDQVVLFELVSKCGSEHLTSDIFESILRLHGERKKPTQKLIHAANLLLEHEDIIPTQSHISSILLPEPTPLVILEKLLLSPRKLPLNKQHYRSLLKASGHHSNSTLCIACLASMNEEGIELGQDEVVELIRKLKDRDPRCEWEVRTWMEENVGWLSGKL